MVAEAELRGRIARERPQNAKGVIGGPRSEEPFTISMEIAAQSRAAATPAERSQASADQALYRRSATGRELGRAVTR